MAGRASGQLTDSQVSTVLFASSVVSGFSVAGSVFILCCYGAFPHLRRFAFTLVFFLSLTDVANQALEWVQPAPGELDAIRASGTLTPLCWAQAITETFLELSSVLWTSAIAYTLHLVVSHKVDQPGLYRRLPAIAAVCLGVPAVLALLPLAQPGAYGPAGAWCWVPSTFPGWQWATFYGPLCVCIAGNAVVYVRALALLRRTVASVGAADPSARALRAVMSRLQLYPAILALVWTPAIVNRVYEAATGVQSFELFLVQRVVSSSQGLLNATVYGLSPGVREALAAAALAAAPGLRRCCGGGGDGGGGARFSGGGDAGGAPAGAAAAGGTPRGTLGDLVPLRPGAGAPGVVGGADEDELDLDAGDLAGLAPPARAAAIIDVEAAGGGTVVANPVVGASRAARVEGMVAAAAGGGGGAAQTWT